MEIWVVPFFGQGHILPSIELCKQIASRGFKTVLVIPSNLSSSVPADCGQNPQVRVAEIPSDSQSDPDPLDPPESPHRHMSSNLENLLKAQVVGPNAARPVCAVLDVMMDWTAEVFQKFEIPTVGFFTSGAASAAMEYAIWKARPVDVGPGEVLLLPGLPHEMALTYADTKQRQHRRPGPPPPHHDDDPRGPRRGQNPSGPPPHHDDQPRGPRRGQNPHGPPPHFGGRGPSWSPPKEDGQPRWLEGIERSIGVMINTCDDLERTFIDYVANQIAKPVWGVGPLLPEQYWKSVGSVVHDHEIRTNRQSNVTEDEVIQWLDSKPHGSVLYVSFGTEVGPTLDEYYQLADALETSSKPFIWVIQHGSGMRGPRGPPIPGSEQEGYFPHGLDARVGPRGLIIHGWAPQLLILSHPSTGGFLSHCGWNSTMEGIGRGVPFLAWPIRGDQYHNAKLLVGHLQVGFRVFGDISEKIMKEDIVEGIERLMVDDEMKQRAIELAAKFKNGFPSTSMAALDAFRDVIQQKTA